MSLVIVAVGKLKGANAYLEMGVSEYLKRLQPYRKTQLIEVAEETVSPSLSETQVMDREADRIEAQLARYQKPPHQPYRVALSEKGETLSSVALSSRLFGGQNDQNAAINPPNRGVCTSGRNPIIFIVGGPLGLSSRMLDGCDWVWSLSPLTFTHPMARLILLEQLYRAIKIERQEPYHKG